jgi:hypothetical protein
MTDHAAGGWQRDENGIHRARPGPAIRQRRGPPPAGSLLEVRGGSVRELWTYNAQAYIHAYVRLTHMHISVRVPSPARTEESSRSMAAEARMSRAFAQ